MSSRKKSAKKSAKKSVRKSAKKPTRKVAARKPRSASPPPATIDGPHASSAPVESDPTLGHAIDIDPIDDDMQISDLDANLFEDELIEQVDDDDESGMAGDAAATTPIKEP